MVNQSDFIKSIENTFDRCLEVVKAKSQDYSGDGDAFSTFRLSEMVGVTVERAILVRMMDKIGRVSSLLDGRTPEVRDERIEDTLTDLINYAAILKTYLELSGPQADKWLGALEKAEDLGYPVAMLRTHERQLDNFLTSRLDKSLWMGSRRAGYVFKDGHELEDGIGTYVLMVTEGDTRLGAMKESDRHLLVD